MSDSAAMPRGRGYRPTFPFTVPMHPMGEPLPTCGDERAYQLRGLANDVDGRPDGIYQCRPGAADWEQVGTVAETVQDAIGAILTDSTSIDLTYNDATPSISAAAIFGTTAGTVAEGDRGAQTGDMKLWPFATPQANWLICDGQTVLRSSPLGVLLVADGMRYGVGNGTTTVNIPDLRDRFPIGLGSHPDNNVLGETGGERNVTLTANESGVPAHTHPSTADGGHDHGGTTGTAGSHNHQYDRTTVSATLAVDFTAATPDRSVVDTIANTGTNTTSDGNHQHGITNFPNHSHTVQANATAAAASPHTNMPPFLAINFVIRT